MRYNYTISHVPGESLHVADTLSRAPCSDALYPDTLLQQETAAYVNLLVQSLPATEKQLDRIKRHQEEDEECLQAAEYTRSGWSSKQSLYGAMKHYHSVATELSVENGLVMRGSNSSSSKTRDVGSYTRGASGNLQMLRTCQAVSLVARSLQTIRGASEKLLRVSKVH